MADLTPVIETMEHRWMRAWVNGDASVQLEVKVSASAAA
jgi:hypothetical protein